MGDPAGVPKRLPDRPRKASAWSGNQRSHFTNPKKMLANKYYLVCRQRRPIFLQKVDWNGRCGTLREKRGMGDPAGAPRRLPPVRGKRVPGVEINVPILQT
ncbi:hypothetical protein, partial [Peribacillus frigoritolerans]|uniref:hypothetical protein n=1 Tax=Peribacillus frigoritolerans TaxID=450367 RepID=UPI00228049D1